MTAWAQALARAFRWKRTLEPSDYTTISELPGREWIAPSQMTRVLRITLLAPNLVDAILDGRQWPGVTLARVMSLFQWSV
jgi:hypothetical protein